LRIGKIHKQYFGEINLNSSFISNFNSQNLKIMINVAPNKIISETSNSIEIGISRSRHIFMFFFYRVMPILLFALALALSILLIPEAKGRTMFTIFLFDLLIIYIIVFLARITFTANLLVNEKGILVRRSSFFKGMVMKFYKKEDCVRVLAFTEGRRRGVIKVRLANGIDEVLLIFSPYWYNKEKFTDIIGSFNNILFSNIRS